jgi:tRNA (guanine-N7-)-methyltransferase
MQDRPLFYDPTEHRIKSFVTRAGRLSPAQAKAIAKLGQEFCIPYTKSQLDYATVFSNTAPTILEIGTGMGETTAHIAAHMPEKNFIGVEVHTPGIGSLLKRIEENQLKNLRLIQHDAVEVLTHMITPATLSGVHVFFPDPWHNKDRQKKHKLLQKEFLIKLFRCKQMLQ